jgi:hypothetical protein
MQAQSGVGVKVENVTDNRVQVGEFQGNLEIKANLTGNGLDKINAARILVKEARDDKGTDLASKGDPPSFTARDMNGGTLSISLKMPPRAAKTVRVAGTLEMFVPSRDPNSLVKVDRALSKLDTPLSSKALKASKIEITPLSPKKYAEEMEKNKLDEKKIAEIREEGKKRGVDETEVEKMIELAKAFQELGGGPPPEGAVILSGKQADLDRVLHIRILKANGEEVHVGSSSSSSSDGRTVMVLEPSEPPPADAAIELTLLTTKATISVPFELKNVSLP